MNSNKITRIAQRHIARCLSSINEVHDLPKVCSDAIIKEMHFCANDVCEAVKQEHPSNDTNEPAHV